MPEPTEHSVTLGSYGAVRLIESQDANVQDLRELRVHLQQQFADNVAAIQAGDWSAVVDYTLPDYIPFETKTYPVDVTRQGEFVSRHPNQFAHLPSRNDVPGVVKLTLGDLDAAAEWGMIPTLNPDSQRRPQANHLRQLGEDVIYRAVVRRVFVARLVVSKQIWKQATALADQAISWSDIPARYESELAGHIKPLTQADMEQALHEPSMLAERITFTLAARLGSRITPPFRPFRARAGVDINEHVDLLLRVEPADAKATLVGIDVTSKSTSEDVWRKHFVQQDSGRSARSGTLRDPATLGRHLPAIRSVLATPNGIYWPRTLHQWSNRRAHTTITPEYLLRFDHRAELGRRILAHVRTPDGQPYYDATALQQMYKSVYGQYDAEHP